MTRKDYILLAEALAQSKNIIKLKKGEYEQWLRDCEFIASALDKYNERFNYTKFLVACKYYDEL